MDDRAKFWERYLPIVNEVRNNIHHVNVEKAFVALFDKIFSNNRNITELPTRMKFDILDMAKYYQNYNYFLKDFYLTYKKKLNEYQEIRGYKPYESFYRFEEQTGRNFNYFSGLKDELELLEKTLADISTLR